MRPRRLPSYFVLYTTIAEVRPCRNTLICFPILKQVLSILIHASPILLHRARKALVSHSESSNTSPESSVPRALRLLTILLLKAISKAKNEMKLFSQNQNFDNFFRLHYCLRFIGICIITHVKMHIFNNFSRRFFQTLSSQSDFSQKLKSHFQSEMKD